MVPLQGIVPFNGHQLAARTSLSARGFEYMSLCVFCSPGAGEINTDSLLPHFSDDATPRALWAFCKCQAGGGEQPECVWSFILTNGLRVDTLGCFRPSRLLQSVWSSVDMRAESEGISGHLRSSRDRPRALTEAKSGETALKFCWCPCSYVVGTH